MRWALSGVLWVLLGAAFAQDDAVVITASRSEQLLRESIPHATVVSPREIRDSQALDLPTLLRREAGFEFVQNGGIGRNSGTFLRGTATAQSLILIDGVRIADLNNGIASLDQIMLDEVERVEIVRGNVSSLYGSGAVGGVIQIFTRRGTGDPRASAEAAVGGEGDRRLRLGYGGQAGDTRFNLTASGFQTDGFSALRPELAPNIDPDRDGYRNESFAGSLSHRVGRHEAGVGYYSTAGRQDYDNAFAFSASDKQTALVRVESMSAFLNSELSSTWLSRLRLGHSTNANHDFENGATSFAGRTKTRNRQLSWENTVALTQEHRLVGGLERMEQELDASETAYVRTDRDIDALFAGYAGRFGVHNVQVNTRYERYTDFGEARSHLIAYALDLSRDWRLFASRSTGFRAPTFNELFFPPIPAPVPGGFIFCSDPALRPERARSGEAGVQYAPGRDLLKIVAFHTRISDLIQPGCPPLNVSEATIDGVEASFSGEWHGARIKAALTLQDPVQHTATTDLALLRRAKRFGSLSATKAVGAWLASAEWLASDSRPDIVVTSFSGERTEVAGYGVVNATARYAVGARTALGVRLDNVFDKDYSLTHGFNTQGRKLTLSLTHTL
jgi:vitamin B12 transporter